MLKKREGNKYGNIELKAIVAEEEENKFEATLMVMKDNKIGKANMTIYQKSREATLTISNKRGSPDNTTETITN